MVSGRSVDSSLTGAQGLKLCINSTGRWVMAPWPCAAVFLLLRLSTGSAVCEGTQEGNKMWPPSSRDRNQWGRWGLLTTDAEITDTDVQRERCP